MADKAREKTDEKLRQMERNIAKMYKTHPAIVSIEKEWDAFMKDIQEQTEDLYLAFRSETDTSTKKELKKEYTQKVRELTLKSEKYKKLIEKFARTMASVNQDALDIVNGEMIEIYADNYNEVANDCKKVGIEVNGL